MSVQASSLRWQRFADWKGICSYDVEFLGSVFRRQVLEIKGPGSEHSHILHLLFCGIPIKCYKGHGYEEVVIVILVITVVLVIKEPED